MNEYVNFYSAQLENTVPGNITSKAIGPTVFQLVGPTVDASMYTKCACCCVNLHDVIGIWKPTASRTDQARRPAVARVRPTVLVVTDLEGHPKSMFLSSSERV